MSRWWVVALVALGCSAMSGCSLDRTGIGGPLGRDAGPPDPILDAGPDAHVDPGIDGGQDAGVDAGSDPGSDAGIDAGSDAGSDAGVDSGFDAGPPPCATRYAGLTHRVCAERPTECELWVMTSGSSCRVACGLAGGTCISSYPDGDDEHPCDRIGAVAGCDVTGNDQICVCSR